MRSSVLGWWAFACAALCASLAAAGPINARTTPSIAEWVAQSAALIGTEVGVVTRDHPAVTKVSAMPSSQSVMKHVNTNPGVKNIPAGAPKAVEASPANASLSKEPTKPVSLAEKQSQSSVGSAANTSMLASTAKATNPSAAPPSDNSHFSSQVCVAIPHARRYQANGALAPPEHDYIRTLLTALHAGLTESQRANVLVYVLNADRDPKGNKEPYDLQTAFAPSNSVRVVESKQSPDQLERSLPATVIDSFELEVVSKSKQVWRAKEVLDTVQLFENCAASGRPHTLFLEDDVAATKDVWAKLERFVKQVPDNYAFLDLYNPSVWEVPEVEYNNGDEYKFYCCTQGMLFSTARLPPIIAALNAGYDKEPVDHLLAQFVQQKDQPNTHVYVSIPNLFQHVGAYSTLAERTFDPPEVQHNSLTWQALLQPSAAAIKPLREAIQADQPLVRRDPDAHFSLSFVP